MTAEFALAVPAALLVLAACLGGLRRGVERIRIVDAAGQVARAAASGDPAPVRAIPAGARVAGTRRTGDVVCAEVRTAVPLLGLPVPLAAESCALAAPLP